MQNTLKVRVYEILERCLEEGYDSGFRRARKHTEFPDQDTVKEHIIRAMMNEVCDYFVFPENE
jgi:hypothetical protein